MTEHVPNLKMSISISEPDSRPDIICLIFQIISSWKVPRMMDVGSGHSLMEYVLHESYMESRMYSHCDLTVLMTAMTSGSTSALAFTMPTVSALCWCLWLDYNIEQRMSLTKKWSRTTFWWFSNIFKHTILFVCYSSNIDKEFRATVLLHRLGLWACTYQLPWTTVILIIFYVQHRMLYSSLFLIIYGINFQT